ncbi:endo alpha-1,4 polygalactosaminidase [Aspergillus foveolatus]|uniref:endo alpha-1,4 polygalactosaminidase n=1 Tax=Aspergillus foveolatus TaxID=210207 RepID=UPI003CCCD542
MASLTLWNMPILITFLVALAALTNAIPLRHAHWDHNHHSRTRTLTSTHTFAPTPTSTPSVTPTATQVTTVVDADAAGPTTSSSSSNEIWQPEVGSPWQIILSSALSPNTVSKSASPAFPIYDIDLFENTSPTISSLHSQGIKVICYFSAGTYEDWRPDASSFDSSSLGAELDDWPGENWIDLRSENVRAIMSSRLDQAVEKGCDGVDPDNVDAYNNGQGGLGLTEEDSADFVNWLAAEAHARGLSIGLKNAGSIIPRVIANMQWSVNEQCAEYDECDVFQQFVDEGKPVFHIEYPENGEVSTSGVDKVALCAEFKGAEGFSTVVKDMDLDEWVQTC